MMGDMITAISTSITATITHHCVASGTSYIALWSSIMVMQGVPLTQALHARCTSCTAPRSTKSRAYSSRALTSASLAQVPALCLELGCTLQRTVGRQISTPQGLQETRQAFRLYCSFHRMVLRNMMICSMCFCVASSWESLRRHDEVMMLPYSRLDTSVSCGQFQGLCLLNHSTRS